MPIQEWEAAAWARGLNRRLLTLEGYFFRAGTGKNSGLSFFVRNEQGLQVGLRRESITQAALYVELVTDHGYSRAQTRFESRWMDVAVYGNDGRVLLYAETKAHARVLEKLCRRLESEFAGHVPFSAGDETNPPHDDALRKAQHIWRHQPKWFWGVSPTTRSYFSVRADKRGFCLEPASCAAGALGGLV